MRPPAAIAAFHRDQQGMLSLVSLCVVLGFLVMFALLANVGQAAKHKQEAQNAADAAATSAGVQLARGLNAVTAANHLIGEFHALVILHHALGGDPLDQGGDRPDDYEPLRQNDSLERDLGRAYRQARNLSPQAYKPLAFQYDPDSRGVGRKLAVNGAIGDARWELKKLMRDTYLAHAIGAILYRIPWTRPLGIAIMTAALIFEAIVYAEWAILNVVETATWTANPFKKTVRGAVIPLFVRYTREVNRRFPGAAEDAAEGAAAKHLATGALYPGVDGPFGGPALALPLRAERAGSDETRLSRSQLLRAATPWVQHWRGPVLRFGRSRVPLSQFAKFYARHTNKWSLTLTARARKYQSVYLYLLADTEPETRGKGREPWTTAAGSRRADALFTAVGFARRAEPPTAAYGIFRRANPDGVAAFAQAIVYNANRQEQNPPADGAWQPVVGWDTLNWDPERRQPEYSRGRGDRPPDVREPLVKLNWQTKLVPTTRLAEAIRNGPSGPLGRILDRTSADRPLANTH